MNILQPIYLDYAATTPVDERVIETMLQYLPLQGDFGNPSSNHSFGNRAAYAVGQAREVIAAAVHCSGKEIIFTSGATESNNMAIKGVAYGYKSRGNHIITSLTEHKAVLDTCHFLENNGFEVTYLQPDQGGLISPEDLAAALKPATVLVSIMHVNNETGVIQDIKTLSGITKKHGALFHTDAAQSMGKLPVNVVEQGIDLMSFTAHKIYGPKGVGGLFAAQSVQNKLSPLLHGGGQESGLRPGTLATHQIAGLGKAVELAVSEIDSTGRKMQGYKTLFLDTLEGIGEIHINGNPHRCIANILNFSISGVSSAALISRLGNEIAFSSGSACISGSTEPSYVLRAMSVDEQWLTNPMRISFGRFTGKSDVLQAAGRIRDEVNKAKT